MKVRSALLVAFMIVVPAAAMFSHRVPADVRRTVRERFSQAVGAASSMVTSSGPVGEVKAPPRPTAPAAPVDRDPAATASAATVGALAPETRAAAPRPPSLDGRLADLGAIAFDVRPVAGGAGGHVATCSVPLDASGQLLRVFHAAGADGTSATAALIADVEAWRLRFEPRRSAGLGATEPVRRF